jgi:hypothetical protein
VFLKSGAKLLLFGQLCKRKALKKTNYKSLDVSLLWKQMFEKSQKCPFLPIVSSVVLKKSLP